MYSDVRNNTIYSNQYSVTEHFKRADIQQGQNMPGVFFFYDLSPIKVKKALSLFTSEVTDAICQVQELPFFAVSQCIRIQAWHCKEHLHISLLFAMLRSIFVS